MDDENVDEEEVERNVRPRIERNDIEEPRIPRQPIVPTRVEPFKENVFLNLQNVQVCRSQTAGVGQRRPFNPTSQIIPMHSLFSNGSHHGTNLLLIILSISSVSIAAPTQFQQKYNGMRGNVSSVRHDRRMVVMCPLSPSGSNTGMILFGSGCCERFFDGDISLRDNGSIRKCEMYTDTYFINDLFLIFHILFEKKIGPGAMLLLSNPPSTDKFIANGATPILMPQRPAVVINSNFHLTSRHIITEGTGMNGFVLHDCTISVLSFHVRNTKCGGNLCDRQQDDVSKCACYQMPNRSGNVIISIDVNINFEDGTTINTTIRSKWFLEKYIFTDPLPGGTRAVNFEDYEVEDRLFLALDKVTKYINRLCKFRIIGWAKRGEVQDQGVDQPNNGLPHNASRTMVQSGTLNHHVTRVDPMRPESVNIEYLNSLKFDIVEGFQTTDDDL